MNCIKLEERFFTGALKFRPGCHVRPLDSAPHPGTGQLLTLFSVILNLMMKAGFKKKSAVVKEYAYPSISKYTHEIVKTIILEHYYVSDIVLSILHFSHFIILKFNYYNNSMR